MLNSLQQRHHPAPLRIGCREWDRLELTIAQTDEAYDCGMPFDIPATAVWTNAVKKRRSKLECEGRVPAYQGSGR
jgi:hypothetical protein